MPILLLLLTLTLVPIPAHALLGGGGGFIYGAIEDPDGSLLHAEEAWISYYGSYLAFVDGRFEQHDPVAAGNRVNMSGTILDAHVDLGTYHPIATTYEGSVLTVHLDLDYWLDHPELEDWSLYTLTMTFQYPNGGLVASGGGFYAHTGLLSLTPTPVPEPATLGLLATGLVGLVISARWGTWARRRAGAAPARR